jgi:hypothetical protein
MNGIDVELTEIRFVLGTWTKLAQNSDDCFEPSGSDT